MNLVIVSGKESFYDNSTPDVNILGYINGGGRENIVNQIRSIIPFVPIGSFILSGYDIERISRIDWSIIIMDMEVYYMIVNLDHRNMDSFHRNFRINSIIG